MNAGAPHFHVDARIAVAGTVALLAILLILLATGVFDRGSARVFIARLGGLLWGSCPSGNFPHDTREALESEAALVPFAAWLS